MLELRGVSAGYGNAAVVHDIDLRVAPGEIVALIGANGAGKSTLVKAISGLLPVRSGTIRFDGAPIERQTPHARVALGVSLVPEGRQVFAGLTVGENLILGAYAKGEGNARVAAKVGEVCRHFPALRYRLGEPAGNLSGGQQQMLAIARGLMSDPRLLLLDEPSLGLAPALVTEIFQLTARLRDQGIAVLLSEQNARLSLAIADRGYVLEMGRTVVEGPGADLARDPEVAERYLGVGKAVSAREEESRRRLAEKLQQVLHLPTPTAPQGTDP